MPAQLNPKGRPSTLPPPWLGLAAKAGGVGNLAREFGVGYPTIGRWATGQMRMSGPAKEILLRLCKIHGLSLVAFQR